MGTKVKHPILTLFRKKEVMEMDRVGRDTGMLEDYGCTIEEPEGIRAKLANGDLEVGGKVRQERRNREAQSVPELL